MGNTDFTMQRIEIMNKNADFTMQRIEIMNKNALDAVNSEVPTIDNKLDLRKRHIWQSNTSISIDEDLTNLPNVPTPKRIRRSIKLNQEKQQQHSEPIDPYQEGEMLEDSDDLIIVDNTNRNIPWWSRSRVWSDSESL